MLYNLADHLTGPLYNKHYKKNPRWISAILEIVQFSSYQTNQTKYFNMHILPFYLTFQRRASRHNNCSRKRTLIISILTQYMRFLYFNLFLENQTATIVNYYDRYYAIDLNKYLTCLCLITHCDLQFYLYTTAFIKIYGIVRRTPKSAMFISQFQETTKFYHFRPLDAVLTCQAN